MTASVIICVQAYTVPREFIKKHIQSSLGKWVLRGPGGQRYDVELERRTNGWFFHSHGWRSFVKDHLLQYGDFLVFRYDDESRFKVKVFDRTCCEKDVEVPKRRSSRPAANEGYPAQDKAEKAEEINVEVAKGRNGLPAAPLVNQGYQFAWVKDEIVDLETESYNRDNLANADKSRRRDNYISGKPPRGEDGKETSTGSGSNRSIIFKSGYSCFKTTLKGRCSQYRVTIPINLAVNKGLITQTTIEIEDSTGRLWPAKLVPQTSKKDNTTIALAMSTGWGECCKANEIVVGNTVVFEFVKETVMRLHVFRKRPGAGGGNNSRDFVVLDAPNIRSKAILKMLKIHILRVA